MAPSATNHTPDPRPTGDLEHLFRQKLGEADVPPRQHVWEQLDHELLIRQNDAYRRRLLLHRWVAAACALLVVGCGSWLLLRGATNSSPANEIAAVTTGVGSSAATEQSATAAASQASSRGARTASAVPTTGHDQAAKVAASVARQGAASPAAPSESVVASVTGSLLRAAKVAVGIRSTDEAVAARTVAASASGQGQEGSRGGSGSQAGGFLPTLTTRTQARGWLTTPLAGSTVEPSALSAAFRRPDTLPAVVVPATTLLAQTPKKAPQAAPAIEEWQEEPKTRGKWRLSGTYAASSYNPNIDFSASGSRSALGFNASPSNNASFDNTARSAYQYGASEYRENLQAGPAQRVVVAAAYALNNHWTLLTGVEAAQQRASSKTSLSSNNAYSAFTGRAAADSIMAQFYNGQRTTDFSYRTVGVPVAVRYGSAKTGWSLYAKVGAAVNVLLKSRTEVDGNSAAARDYTLASSDSPYRKVLTSVRGGGGVRYQPTDASWSLALGPVAEAGLNTLNQNPSGAFLRRARPYAVGLEASVEFGGQKVASATR